MSTEILLAAFSIISTTFVCLTVWSQLRTIGQTREYLRELKRDAEGNRALAALAGGESGDFTVESKPWQNECRACLSSKGNAKGSSCLAPRDCNNRCPRPVNKHIHLECTICRFEFVREL